MDSRHASLFLEGKLLAVRRAAESVAHAQRASVTIKWDPLRGTRVPKHWTVLVFDPSTERSFRQDVSTLEEVVSLLASRLPVGRRDAPAPHRGEPAEWSGGWP